MFSRDGAVPDELVRPVISMTRSSPYATRPPQKKAWRGTYSRTAPIYNSGRVGHAPQRASARGAELADLVKPGQVNAGGLASSGTQVIHCRRVGMHRKVPVRLDIHGVEVKCAMLLDTGASVTVLPKSVYRRGLARPLSGLRRIRLKTANGPMTCPVDRLHVSTTAYGRTLPVALTNDSVALLGANYFEGYRITIDLDRACIYVHPVEKQ